METPDSNLIFKDDFSSGDLSKYNNHFRWGRSGAIKDSTGESSSITSATGPDGQKSRMMIFDYKPGSHWDEVRFHLTKNIDEKRTELGLSDVAYPELWVRFWMRIPDNYYHDGSERPNNNKGWIYLWNGAYESSGEQPPSVSNSLHWWPVNEPEQAAGNSYVTVEKTFLGGHDRTPDYVHPDEQLLTKPEQALAISKQEQGQWIDYAFHFRLASGLDSADGIIEIWKNGERAISWNSTSWPRNGNTDRAGFDRGYLMGYHNAPVEQRQVYYLDDFRIGTTAESVGLSN